MLSYKLFGDIANKYCDKNPKIAESLLKAQRKLRAEVFVATLIYYAIIGAAVGAGIGVAVNLIFDLPTLFAILVWAAPGIIPMMVFFIGTVLPTAEVNSRGSDIDRNLAYAVNYMAAMASANVNPNIVFRGLSDQEIYGEVRKEAAMIARDIDILNKDLVSALKDAVKRSPSVKFSEFLQGIITTITSGGSLKLYFSSKADQYMKENRVEQHGTLETLGVMAESFVTVVVAAPLFLIVMMSVMAMMGNGDTMILYLIIGLMIPLAQFLFVFIIHGMKLGD